MLRNKKSFSLLLAFALVFNTTVATASTSVNNKKQEQKENDKKINDLKEKNKNLEKEKGQVQSEIKDITTDIAEKINVINDKDKELSDVEKKINDLENSIIDLQNETKVLEEGIKEKEREFKEKEELLDERLRAIYKNNTYSELFFVIFESNSFSDFISRVENIKRMVTYDKDLMEEIKSIQDELKEKEEKLMDDRKNLEDKKGQLDGAKNRLAEEKKTLEQSKKELEAMENQKLAKASSLTAEQKKVQKETAHLEDINEDIQREIDSIISASGSKGNGDSGQTTKPSSGGWIYPVSAPITSQFGYRVHPVTGEKKLHTGTDFGAPMGAPIKAVKDGQVIFAGLNSGYGKMVIVDHGNGIQTLYAHSSSLNVSTGDKVKQGQVIAKVGSTGMSTGPHLHLEFLVNGSRVNPMSYLG